MDAQPKRYLRKNAVATRYAMTTRTVDRKSRNGSLPPPQFPAGPTIPLWAEDELDAHDAQARAEATAA